MNRYAYVQLFDCLSDAIAFEDRVLSSGFDALPECALVAITGEAEPAPEYWSFLADQLAAVQRESC